MTLLVSTPLRLAATGTHAPTSATIASVQALLCQYLRACKSTGVDAIDCFTNDLVERKTHKWRTLRVRMEDQQQQRQHQQQQSALAILSTISGPQHTLRKTATRILRDLHDGIRLPRDDVRLCLNLSTLQPAHIDQLLCSALNDQQQHDFYSLIDECLRWRKLPTEPVLLDCLHYLCQNAAGSAYPRLLIALVAQQQPAVYAAHGQFLHFRAQERWHQGRHVEALQALHQVYVTMRQKHLVEMAVQMRMCLRETVAVAAERAERNEPDAEVVLDVVEKTAEDLSRVFGEDEMLMWLWRCCFASEWFGLQQRAGRMFAGSEDVRMFVGQK